MHYSIQLVVLTYVHSVVTVTVFFYIYTSLSLELTQLVELYSKFTQLFILSLISYILTWYQTPSVMASHGTAPSVADNAP